MADNSNSRKKALIVGVLAFLFAGGGVFLFFIIQASNDLTGANKKSGFTYGGVAREATASFFKFVGFDDVESMIKEPPAERPRLKEYEEAGLLDAAPPAAAAADADMPWAPSAASGRSASPSSVPKMGGRGGSGVGGLGGGGSKSSGGMSRFDNAPGAGNTKVSANTLASAGGAPSKGTFASLKNTRAMLGEGLRSGSAMTAKGKWDSSFGVGRAGGGSGADLAYGKPGLVNLDKIKKGEVDNLKTTEKGSLKVPDVGAPEKDKDAEGKDPVIEKAKEAAEDAVTKGMASAMTGAIGQGLNKGMGSGDDRTAPMESGQCDASAGPQTQVCTGVLAKQAPGDTGASYKQVGTTAEGRVYEVSFLGSGPGITEKFKGAEVNYNDTATMVIKKDGSVTFSGWKNNEVPLAESRDSR
ncbi:MAG: hypothetical protein A2081_01525 [Elusimicrobia bacterium GWC2_61_19]|nr:MAG: hypothetical protein A2081_01525 [Elusimicrobia bacterium GWC2_61_19]